MNDIAIRRILLLILILVTSGLSTASGEEKQKPDAYSGVVIGTGGAIGARSMNIDIQIDKYTTDQEIGEYIDLLKEKGQDQLRLKLEKVKVGNIRPSASVGTELAIARVFETLEGKVIRLLTARNMRFLELYHGGRSTDYPFTIVEIHLDKEGKGEGAIMGGAQISFSKEGKLEIESFGNQYAKLVNVRTWD
jgi:hypothetical protein